MLVRQSAKYRTAEHGCDVAADVQCGNVSFDVAVFFVEPVHLGVCELVVCGEKKVRGKNGTADQQTSRQAICSRHARDLIASRSRQADTQNTRKERVCACERES